jgi:hypothetical protein
MRERKRCCNNAGLTEVDDAWGLHLNVVGAQEEAML